jgi:AcrR family transcriptional regulator
MVSFALWRAHPAARFQAEGPSARRVGAAGPAPAEGANVHPRGSEPGGGDVAAVKMGRRERRKIAIRSDLERAARELFGEQGIYDARIEDLAERAGIAKGTVYLYFRSKEELVQAVVEAAFDSLGRNAAAAAEGARTFPDLVGRIVVAHLEFFTASPDLMRLLHQVRGVLMFQRQEWRALRLPLGRHIEQIARLLARVPSPVRDRSAKRRLIAVLIFAAISGATSVRAALAGRPSSEVSTATLRRGVTALAVALARGAASPRRRRRTAAERS